MILIPVLHVLFLRGFSFKVFVEEEQAGDSETSHGVEKVLMLLLMIRVERLMFLQNNPF